MYTAFINIKNENINHFNIKYEIDEYKEDKNLINQSSALEKETMIFHII